MTTSLYLAMSVDGLISTSNRVSNESSEWPESGWARWCGRCTTSNNIIVGRKTYTELTEFDVSDMLYPDHKVVISSQDLDLVDGWVQYSNPKQAIDYLKSCDIENIIVGGGRQLGLAFIKEDLIDEIVLDIHPILFGSGTQLLGELDKCIQLDLVNSEKIEDGGISVHYKILKE
jgi:dihydrofolate reductase